jgi:hypothetical protein
MCVKGAGSTLTVYTTDSLSGCPAMTGMYSTLIRHNELGGQGYKTVCKGKLGAAVVCQDMGMHNVAETPEEQAEIRCGGSDFFLATTG